MVRVHLGRLVSYLALTVSIAVLLLTLTDLSALRRRPSVRGNNIHVLQADQSESRDTLDARDTRGTGDMRDTRFDVGDTRDIRDMRDGTRETRRSDPTLMIDDSAVRELRSRPGGRVLCWVPTTPKQLEVKVRAINATWIQRCDGHIFFMEPEKGQKHDDLQHQETKEKLPFWDVVSLDVPPGYYNLTTKVVTILLYLYRYHLNDYDWFLKGDDDAYVVMENVRYLLSLYNPEDPVYLGHLFKRFVPQGYMAGGAAYVLSREALRLVAEEGYSKNKCATKGRYEDVEVGRCLHAAGVASFNTRDRFDRDTFHPLRPATHMLGPIPAVQLAQDYFTMVSGKECCSQLTISFHKVQPHLMMIFDHLLYRTSVYGRVLDMEGLQGLIKPRALPPVEK